jgi:hypothetical protein
LENELRKRDDDLLENKKCIDQLEQALEEYQSKNFALENTVKVKKLTM